jgi:hypothetical protein
LLQLARADSTIAIPTKQNAETLVCYRTLRWIINGPINQHRGQKSLLGFVWDEEVVKHFNKLKCIGIGKKDKICQN